MNDKRFQTLDPYISENPEIRIPQLDGYEAIAQHFATLGADREVGIVLPVGCGKSGLITLAPFATKSSRVLVVAPGVRIAQQLYDDFNPSNSSMFYQKCEVITEPPYPELAEIRGRETNRDDLEHADVVITNIQQLQGESNRWLDALPADFFDLILFDEAHHNVAESWEALRKKFPDARIINFSATPTRADGQLMAGRIIYSYPIFKAIKLGYVKRIKAVVLNPKTLRYVRNEDGKEIEVDLEEVKRLGEVDADFRRSIVSSKETLSTIVDASIRELERLRDRTGDRKHKIIASALNQQHCIQIVQAYRERDQRADYIHSNEGGQANKRVLQQLENHELDVIVQVRMLGEGFDHPYLSVAAVFSIFKNLSPFAQFAGRIMRVIKKNAPRSPLNQGTVVYHAGGNVAKVWDDFREFSQADQDFFDQLLPTEDLHFEAASELEIEPHERDEPEDRSIDIRHQAGVSLEEIPLIENDEKAREALEYLIEQGLTVDEYQKAQEQLRRVPTTRLAKRRAARAALDERIRVRVGQALRDHGLSHEGKDLDRQRRGRTNFVVLKAAIDNAVNERVGYKSGERHEFTLDQLNQISEQFDDIVISALEEVVDGQGEGSA